MAITKLISKTKASATFHFFSKPATSLPSSQNQIIPNSTTSNTFSELIMQENIENAKTIITKYDIDGPNRENFSSIFQENRNGAKTFISCVKGLKETMNYLVKTYSYGSTKIVLAQNLMQVAMKRLELEFHLILTSNKEHLKPESISSHSSSQSITNFSSSDDEIDRISTDDESESVTATAMLNLKQIADCMISAGYSKECARKFMIIRKSVTSEMFYNLGIESYSSTKIKKMNSNDLKDHIKKWIYAAKYVVKSLIGERFLVDYLFSTTQTIREFCFAEIVIQEAMNLFKFPELVAKRWNSPDIAFSLLDIYEGIQEIIPNIESIFSYESISSVKIQASSSLHALSNSIQLILTLFETSLQKDSFGIVVPGGGIHPSTMSVLDFASSLANYSHVLTEIIINFVAPEKVTFIRCYFDEASNSAVSIWQAWVLLVLLCKLDYTAEFYNDVALSYLFLANNIQYIIEKVSTSSLKYLLGDEYIAKLDRKVKSYAANYEEIAWSKAITCLPQDPTAEMSPDRVKGRFKKFNEDLEEALRKQMAWVIPDRKLREEIKLSIGRKLVPAYQNFYNSQMKKFGPEKNLQRSVRLSPDDLGNCLSNLFHGVSVSGSSPSSSRN
ncbi:membrane traffic protein [Lithospermum erythrorhizon]|uniref:Exocyst subunit Exo70 family protein n=1 Tax=Lithospermum erythrorhizon TaxID=34254 RepID=A0AAV3RBX1_LITER